MDRGRPRKELDVKSMVEDYEQGASVDEIAEWYGVGVTTVRDRLTEAGVAWRASGRSAIELDVEEIVRRYRAGAGTRQIGVDLGVAANTIRNRLIEAGVPLRPPGRHS